MFVATLEKVCGESLRFLIKILFLFLLLMATSTFGQGYFQVGNKGVNPFARFIPAYLKNVHMMKADVRPTGEMRKLPVHDLIAWFVNDTAALN
jgi:hypothetical protein